jgi:ATP-dependent DNA helicase RecQ
MKNTPPVSRKPTPDLKKSLTRYFGYTEFREGQEAVICCLLEGKSAAAVFPTGGGKSLCYQLPALLFSGLTIVVSPLIALMKDQIDALQQRGIRAARLDSSLSLDEYREVADSIKDGTLKLLYVAPERFNNERFRASLTTVDISLFAVDEAHCISEWGHNFRPDYLKLVTFAGDCGAQRILALTATATRDVLTDICTQFRIAPECAVNTGFYRSNLNLSATAVSASERDAVLLKLLNEAERSPTIVYVTLQKTAEKVAEYLSANGFSAQHYHAGLKDDQRSRVQDWFLESADGVVVATIAFGMGIDKSNIRGVYHYNLPKSLENYAQEIGRAGRDGEPAVCHLLACPDDLIPLENFIYGDTPTNSAIERLLAQVLPAEDEYDLSMYELARDCDIRPLVLKTLLTKLELEGYLKGGTPFYADYQFKPLLTSKEILAKFDETRRQFIAGIFRTAIKARTWYRINLGTTALELDVPRDRLIRALDYLAEQRMLEVKVSGVRNRYQVVKRPGSASALAVTLSENSRLREQRELARLDQTVEWITLNRCRTAALVERFEGTLMQDCGHCSWCESKAAVVLKERSPQAVGDDVLNSVLLLHSAHPDVLPGAVEITRVLCGLSSPGISRKKLQKDPLFGCCESIHYPQVLSAVAEIMSDTAGNRMS